jgi:SAM-dependent methyltransferase
MPGAYRDWWAPVPDALAAPALAALPITGGGETWLDLATGTGIAARRLSARLPAGGHVIAADLVPAMLREARASAPHIPLVRLDAARLPFADRGLDGVVCTFALHHIREQRRALAEVHRCLAPGGRLLVLTWGAEDDPCPAMQAWEEALSEAGAPADDPEPPPTWSEEVNTPERLTALLAGLGFAVVWVTPGPPTVTFTPESLANLRLRVGGHMRRFRALPYARQSAFEARARRLLAALPPEAFAWRPHVVTARVTKPGEASGGNGAGGADFRTTCPNCGATMYDRGCKTRCPRCHFFTDCSDPW